jgi:hypothetical protein
VSSLASASNSSRTPADVRPAFAALVLAMLPAVLDQTVLATALPTVATDLGRLGDVSWLVTAYVVTATAATPLWGKLGDRNGRRPMLIAALAGFLCASAVCGLAQNLEQLIAARAVQGLAAGGLMSLAMASVGEISSPRASARWQGRISVVFASATVVGPVLGGVVVQHVSWRWVFYLNLPLGAAALLGIRRWLGRRGGADASTPLDLPGALYLGGATVCALLACSWAGDRFGWRSLPVAALAAGCWRRRSRSSPASSCCGCPPTSTARWTLSDRPPCGSARRRAGRRSRGSRATRRSLPRRCCPPARRATAPASR